MLNYFFNIYDINDKIIQRNNKRNYFVTKSEFLLNKNVH